ncbi:hypothetical protein C8R43DRAFT_987182 [Mycena crocata]|nr:hypothetical protein C8R43DRAFT_987182 [Mycena crocata]
MLRAAPARQGHRLCKALANSSKKLLCSSNSMHSDGGRFSPNQNMGFRNDSMRRLLLRSFYSTVPDRQDEQPARSPSEEEALAALEEVAKNTSIIAVADAENNLRLSYATIYEIINYLTRNEDGTGTYLSVFTNSETSSNSNLYRSRSAVFKLTKTVVARLSSISESSPLRKHSGIFDLLGALEPLFLVYDDSHNIQEWRDFWGRAQPVLLSLAAQLDEAGFGGD